MGLVGLRGTMSKEKFKEQPSIITQKKLSPRVSSLLQRLVSAQVASKKALLDALKTSPTFLMEEVQAFLVVEARKDFRGAWQRLAKSL